MGDPTAALTRRAASVAVESIGWRYLLGTLRASVAVAGFRQSVQVGVAVAAACGDDADGHLRVDLRPDRVELSLQTGVLGAVTEIDTAVAHTVTRALAEIGFRTAAATGVAAVTGAGTTRPVEVLELAVDALDIPAVRPFWRAVLAYVDGVPGGNDLVDPAGQLPALWFQQMAAPRPQRNRIHLDITVAHDEAEPRIRAALAAGGVLVDDSHTPSFSVLADPEGNEVCVCTWTGRDQPAPES